MPDHDRQDAGRRGVPGPAHRRRRHGHRRLCLPLAPHRVVRRQRVLRAAALEQHGPAGHLAGRRAAAARFRARRHPGRPAAGPGVRAVLCASGDPDRLGGRPLAAQPDHLLGRDDLDALHRGLHARAGLSGAVRRPDAGRPRRGGAGAGGVLDARRLLPARARRRRGQRGHRRKLPRRGLCARLRRPVPRAAAAGRHGRRARLRRHPRLAAGLRAGRHPGAAAAAARRRGARAAATRAGGPGGARHVRGSAALPRCASAASTGR